MHCNNMNVKNINTSKKLFLKLLNDNKEMLDLKHSQDNANSHTHKYHMMMLSVCITDNDRLKMRCIHKKGTFVPNRHIKVLLNFDLKKKKKDWPSKECQNITKNPDKTQKKKNRAANNDLNIYKIT